MDAECTMTSARISSETEQSWLVEALSPAGRTTLETLGSRPANAMDARCRSDATEPIWSGNKSATAIHVPLQDFTAA
jgi:hypothetical protein